MKQAKANEIGTKYGFKKIPVGEKKVIQNAVKSVVLQAARSWNNRRARDEWVGLNAEQVGSNVVVQRIY